MSKYGTFIPNPTAKIKSKNGDLASVANPKLKRGYREVKKSDVLKAYADSMKGANYTPAERKRYMSYAESDVGGWLGERIPELLGLKGVHYTKIIVKDDLKKSKNPIKYWIVDNKGALYLTVKGSREKAERLAGDLNKKAGKELYSVLGYGTENPTGRTFNIYYSKQFETGLLKGLITHESVSFATQKAADNFARTMRRGTKHKDALTKDRFIVTDISYQKYDRS